MEHRTKETSQLSPASFLIHEDHSFSPTPHSQTDRVKENPSHSLAEGVAIPLVTSRFVNQRVKDTTSPTTQGATLSPKIDHKASRTSEDEQGQQLGTTLDISSKLGEGVHEKNLSESEQLVKLKMELEAANSRIARMDAELSQSKIANHTIEQALGSPLDDSSDRLTNSTLKVDNAGTQGRSFEGFAPTFQPSYSDDCTPASFSRTRNAHTDSVQRQDRQNSPSLPFLNSNYDGLSIWSQTPSSAWNLKSRQGDAAARRTLCPQPQHQANFGSENVLSHMKCGAAPDSVPWESNFLVGDSGVATGSSSAVGKYFGGTGSYPASTGGHTDFSSPMSPMSFTNMGFLPEGVPYLHRGLGMSASPASVVSGGTSFTTPPWNSHSIYLGTGNTLIPNSEPMNYRKLLDRNMNCNWKYIVEKIVSHNDQQASIFLQQKLKVATAEQKHDLIQAIIGQAYPLMVNRFGNFLVQRCFEHGTSEQITAIADVIQGNVLNLSMDAFGCHVIQKAFDVVPEDYKARMVHELLRCIPETVIHRYACHVWQKLFELRWNDSPPQIMKYVNEALRGMWHEVALGETGSLVVQNIFENCLEEDKRLCVGEVLASIDVISHGQFGNWCIQHICEHGVPADKNRAIEHVLRFASEYSTDQYASKVVEKCLKVGGPAFLERYLERVCEGRPDRPRMPLIDIAGDQYGNYLIQYILINASPQHREVVANHIRKHMVSLRGSKFGSRVALACSNPAVTTRPGPPTGLGASSGRFNANNLPRAMLGTPYR